MNTSDILMGQKANIYVEDAVSSVEREVTVVEKDLFSTDVLYVSAIHELNEQEQKALVVLDYGACTLLVPMGGCCYSVPVAGVSLVKKEGNPCYKLKLASSTLDIINRRKNKRFPIMADAEMLIAPAPPASEDGEGDDAEAQAPAKAPAKAAAADPTALTGFLKDISFNGLCFGMASDLVDFPIDTPVQVNISCSGFKPVSVSGNIRYCRAEELENNRIHSYYGIQLVAEYAQIRNLVNVVERRALAALRHDPAEDVTMGM